MAVAPAFSGSAPQESVGLDVRAAGPEPAHTCAGEHCCASPVGCWFFFSTASCRAENQVLKAGVHGVGLSSRHHGSRPVSNTPPTPFNVWEDMLHPELCPCPLTLSCCFLGILLGPTPCPKNGGRHPVITSLLLHGALVTVPGPLQQGEQCPCALKARPWAQRGGGDTWGHLPWVLGRRCQAGAVHPVLLLSTAGTRHLGETVEPEPLPWKNTLPPKHGSAQARANAKLAHFGRKRFLGKFQPCRTETSARTGAGARSLSAGFISISLSLEEPRTSPAFPTETFWCWWRNQGAFITQCHGHCRSGHGADGEAQGDISSATSHTEPVSGAVPAGDRQIAACFGDAVALLELH